MADDQGLQKVKKQRQLEEDGNVHAARMTHAPSCINNNEIFFEDPAGQPPLHITESEILFPNVTGSTTSTPIANTPQDAIICKYFVAGTCAYGIACRFSHTLRANKKVNNPALIPSVISVIPRSSAPNQMESALAKDSGTEVDNKQDHQFSQPYAKPVCRFYGSLRGCKAGAACPFLHKDEPKQSFLSSHGASEGGSILNKYSSVKIAEKAGVEAFTRTGVNI